MATAVYIRYPAAGSGGSSGVNIHDSAGNNISNGQQTKANSIPVVIASDQGAIATSSPVNTNGQSGQITNLGTSAQTLTAPANSVGFILMSVTSNTAKIRWRIGAAATTAIGMRLEIGADTGFIPCAKDVSVCAESGTNQEVDIQWVLSS